MGDNVPVTPPDYALLDRLGAASQIFFPRPDLSRPPAGAEDVRFEVQPGVALSARLYAFDKSWPTILYFHGNGEVVGDHDDISEFYRGSGLNLLVVDFRGYGQSDGRPTFATLVSDGALAAARFHEALDARGFGEERLVMGRSLGAHPALEVAANASGRFSGLIIESGAGNMRRIASRFGVEANEAAGLVESHDRKIASITLPALFIHGERDDLIPIESAAELYGVIGSTQKEFVALEGAGHNDLLWLRAPEYFEAIKKFVAVI